VFDEVHARKALVHKDVALGEGIIVGEFSDIPGAALHRLEDQTPADERGHLFQRIQRVPQVVENAQEEYIVELVVADDAVDVVDVALDQLHVQVQLLARETRLVQVDRVVVDAQYPRGAAPLELERVEAAVAADVQHCPAAEVVGYGVLEELPEIGGKIAQRMIGRGLDR